MVAERLLMTGPVLGLDRWRAALEQMARAGGAAPEVLERPLIELRSRALAPIVHRPNWLCLTSQSALPSLELRWAQLVGLPCAVVGERTAAILEERGLEVAAGPCPSAEELLAVWKTRLRPTQRVLWPRGNRSDAVARALRAKGVLVDAPIVYETRPSADRHALPAAELVFFASPSAVAEFARLERVDPDQAPIAIAIGPTTAAALRKLSDSPFRAIETLDQPRPLSLLRTLERLREAGI